MSMLDTTLVPAAEAAVASPRPLAARLADFRELSKPRIAAMALLTVSMGYLLAGPKGEVVATLVHTLFGVGLVAAASGTLNQLVERKTDAKMIRTANRPLPAGRIAPGEALAYGLTTGVLGVVWLAAFVNVTTAVLSAATLLLYAFAYTPLKRVTSLCTVVGAVPGALPPVLGWTAAGGDPLSAGAVALFGILFLWQFPHLFAIAWLYRQQYADAGLHMLPGQFPRKRLTGLLSLGHAAALLPISLLPYQTGMAGVGYAAAAVVLAAGYALCSVLFFWDESVKTARRLLWSSLLYLPILLAVLTFDHFRLHG
jgi:protoheme IX farnesyltransferase